MSSLADFVSKVSSLSFVYFEHRDLSQLQAGLA